MCDQGRKVLYCCRKERDFRDYAIISWNHPLNGYCCPVISTTGMGEKEKTMVWDGGAKKAMYAPRKWANTIDYILPLMWN
jgi:hypothetical protein